MQGGKAAPGHLWKKGSIWTLTTNQTPLKNGKNLESESAALKHSACGSRILRTETHDPIGPIQISVLVFRMLE